MPGQIDIDEVKKDINKRAGEKLAHNLKKEDPTEVDHWISTDCFLLDCTIAQGMRAGIPSGKIVELAGEEATGKSFFASLIAGNALGSGDVDLVVYFDSEEAQNSEFMENAGVDLDKLLYVQAKSVEFVFETIEQLLGEYENILFIWDSIAMTGHKAQEESDFGQRQDVAAKARILSDAFKRVTIPLGNTSSTLLCTNQIRDYIPKAADPHSVKFTKPTYTPGGRTLRHAYSLRIWLRKRDANSASVLDENGTKVGAEVTAELKKSRFGTEERSCVFDIIWGGGNVGIREKPYWLDELKSTEYLSGGGGGWYTLEREGYKKKFQSESGFVDALEEDEKFHSHVMEILEDKIIKE